MDLEYTLIDCATGLIYGPYETFLQARERAGDPEYLSIETERNCRRIADVPPPPKTLLEDLA